MRLNAAILGFTLNTTRQLDKRCVEGLIMATGANESRSYGEN
jgi:hypothetical protein